MGWLKNLLSGGTPVAERITEFKYVPEPGAKVVPNVSAEEARRFIEGLGAFELTRNDGKVPVPDGLPKSVREFFTEFSSVWNTQAEIFLDAKELYYDEELGLWWLENNTQWDYRLFAFPTEDSKLYLHFEEHPMPVCNDIFDSVWHYLWGFHLIFSDD